MYKKMENPLLRLITLYVMACAGYIFWIHFFTIPVHLGVDEELYISMARSFHYTGHFSENGQILNYPCYLYSLLISVAYFFYSPEWIVFLIRCIGVVFMLSSIFPVYFLTKEILGQSRTVWILTILSTIIPSMADTAYCMQETMAYPLMLWIFYLIYHEGKGDKIGKLTYESILIALLAAVAFYIKTYLIIVPAAYCIYLLLAAAKETGKKIGWKIILFSGIYLSVYGLGKLGLYLINAGIAGTNHYAAQFERLFPIDLKTILSILACILFYLAALIVYWGVLPVVLTIVNHKKYNRQDRFFILFIEILAILMILEIVITIVVTEEGKIFFPHKFLYRYFQILEIPLFCMFLKLNEKKASFKYVKSIMLISFGYMIVYFGWMADEMRTAIIDAPLFLLLENGSKYIGHYMGSAILGMLMIAELLLLWKKEKLERTFISIIERACRMFLAAFFVLNLVQLPYYANVIAKGAEIQKDAHDIAEYLNKNNISCIYYIQADTDRYEQAVYAYLKSDMKLETVHDVVETDDIPADAVYVKAASNAEVTFGTVLGNEMKLLQMGRNPDTN